MVYISSKAVQIFSGKAGNGTGQAKLLYKTASLCEKCCSVVPAQVLEINGKVFLEKECCLGKRRVLRENDKQVYMTQVRTTPSRIDPPLLPGVSGAGESSIQLFKFFVTPKCDAKCQVCIMDWQMGRDYTGLKRVELTPALLESALSKGKISGKELMFSGGEPAVSKHLPELVRIGKEHNNKVTVLSNGKRISEDAGFVGKLKAAGLDSVQLSFDSLDDSLYPKIKGEKNLLGKKLSAIMRLEKEGIPVVLSPTIIGGHNDKQIGALLSFAVGKRKAVRQIIYRPFAPIGRVAISPKNAVTPSDIMKALEKQTYGKVKQEDFLAFMEMRMSFFRLAERVLGKTAAYKFAWGRGYSVLLKVGKKNSYCPYFSASQARQVSKIINSALREEKNGTLLVSKLFAKLVPVLGKEKVSFLAKAALSKNRLFAMYDCWGENDVFQVHIADPFYRLTADYRLHSNVYDVIRYEDETSKGEIKTFNQIAQAY